MEKDVPLFAMQLKVLSHRKSEEVCLFGEAW